MTHVASKQLCQELYELSRWDISDGVWVLPTSSEENTQPYVIKRRDYPYKREEAPHKLSPAYDLGYLLRKLKDAGIFAYVKYSGTHWMCDGGVLRGMEYADEPEDAACKLAIELFKQGVLKLLDKEES